MIKLTYKERQKAMTTFAQEPSLDVQTIMRDGKPLATITRSNQIVEWRY